MSDNQTLQEQLAQLLKPKVTGNGVVIKKDGTVSKPEKEKQNGSNA